MVMVVLVTCGWERCRQAVPHCGQRQLTVVYVRTDAESLNEPFTELRRSVVGKSLDFGGLSVVVVMQLKLFLWLIGVDFGVMLIDSVDFVVSDGSRFDFSEIHG